MPEQQQQTDPSGQNPSPEPDAEKAYWDKLTAHLDTWFDGKVKTLREQSGPGTSRTGRTTLPRILADFMFGPEK